MLPTRGTTSELQELQRSLRDLVALSTLPAVWAETSPTNIVGSLAEVLHRALSLDFVYVHAHREEGANLEAVRANPTCIPAQTAQSFGQALSPWLKSDALGVHSISNPCGSGVVHMIVLPLGHGAHGFVAAGSARPDFPSETEQLLLRVGANQAEIVLERKWADEALRESQQRLQATYYCAPVGIAETSPEGKFVKVNEELCRTLGYNQDELFQRSIEDVTHAEDCSLDMDLHRQLIAGEIPSYQIEKRFVRKDGSIVWTEIRRSAVRDAEGALLHTIGAVRDITDRKRLEESQRENEERQAFLLRLTDELRPLGDPLDTQEVAARLLGEHLRVNRVGYAEIDARGYVIRREYARGVRPLVGQGPAGTFGAALRDAYKSGETVVVNDVGTDPRFTEAERATMQARQIAAYVGVTLIKNGRLVAAFGANNATPRVWTSKEVELIRDVAERTWEAVERARAETAVREREQRLRLALEASGAGSWMRDLRTDRADWDGRFREIYGITAGEPASFEAWMGRVHEEDRRRVRELWDRILHTKTHDTFDYTFRIVRSDGTVAWIQSLGQAHRDASGQLIRLTGIELDITDRKRTEEALRSISAELQQTVHIAATGLNHCSRDLRYLSANPAYARYVGVPLQQIIGRPIPEVIGEAAFEIIRPRIERVLRGEMVEYEDELPYPNGNKWMRGAYTPDRDASGNVVGWVASIMDITERKRAEEAARQQANLLRLSFDAIIVWRAGGGIESWNRGAEMLYGFTEREAIGQRPDDLLKPVFPVPHSEIKKGLTDQGNWEGEVRHRTKDGREVIVSSRLQHVAGDDGTVRVLAMNRDITENRRLEEERAAEGRRKDEFLSMLGHELRNPLATISTAVQLLSGGLTDDERLSLNGMMDRQVKLMGRLLDDLLDLGRMTHGYIQLRKERIDLAKLLQHVTEVTQSTAAERGQELTLRLPSEIVTFKADQARLEQIAINLLSNASKYTPQGGRIELLGTREGSEVVIRCKDNGRGIPREMQQKIFEPFTRVEPFSDSRGEASLGIGLALVKRLVELHGGTISVESGGPGMGSEFVVRLPLESAPSDQPAAPKAKPASTSGLSRSIALVEDNSDAAGTMVIFLEKAGYRVTLYANAFSALAGLSDLKPHAILLDIGLPGMDGYKLAAKLKEKPDLQHTLFIGLSGFKRREATKSGDDFDYYFNKPVDLPALLAVLDTPAPLRKGKAATARTAANDVKTLRVLLIDDHAELAAAMAALLRSEGLEVRTALSGRESLQAALDFKPELTLCDLNLPDMQGHDVIRLLRSNPLMPPTCAVVLTAMSDQEIRDLNREAKRMGIDEFIPKPLTTETVRRLVTKCKRQQSA